MNEKEHGFIIQAQLDGLLSAKENILVEYKLEPEAELLSMQAVVNTALYPHSNQSQHDMLIINQHLTYRRWYKNALNAIGAVVSDSQAAASSAPSNIDSFVRKGIGFSIKLVHDQQHSDDVYVIVTMDHMDEHQYDRGVFLHTESNETFLVLHLDNPVDNRLQTIISAKSEYYASFIDADSIIYLT
jgi:hypothetical protein